MTPGAPTPGSSDALSQMLAWLNGHCLEQALRVTALLGIADRLADGERGVEALAAEAAADASALYRMLRMLASFGVFEERPGRRFALTPLGDTLRSDVAHSVRDRALFYGAPAMWAAWGELLHSIHTGGSAVEHRHGLPFYAFAAKEDEVGIPFNRYMTRTSDQHVPAILAHYDFSGLRHLIDVGGGHGQTLAAILRSCPSLQGTLFDLPSVVAAAAHIQAPDIASRCTAVGGDMARGVPPDANGYLLKWVLMDRADAEAVAVLRHCRDAMAPGGRVLAVEMVLPEGEGRRFGTLMDVQMLLVFGGGCVRTEAEYAALFRAAGLEVTAAIRATPSPNLIMEGRCGAGL